MQGPDKNPKEKLSNFSIKKTAQYHRHAKAPFGLREAGAAN